MIEVTMLDVSVSLVLQLREPRFYQFAMIRLGSMSRPHISVLSSEVALQRIYLPTPASLVFGHQDGAVIGLYLRNSSVTPVEGTKQAQRESEDARLSSAYRTGPEPRFLKPAHDRQGAVDNS